MIAGSSGMISHSTVRPLREQIIEQLSARLASPAVANRERRSVTPGVHRLDVRRKPGSSTRFLAARSGKPAFYTF
jgi:hypothetical protein